MTFFAEHTRTGCTDDHRLSQSSAVSFSGDLLNDNGLPFLPVEGGRTRWQGVEVQTSSSSPAHNQGTHHSRHHQYHVSARGDVTTVQNALHGLPEKRKRELCEKLCSTITLWKVAMKTWVLQRYLSPQNTNQWPRFTLPKLETACPSHSGTAAAMASSTLPCALWLPLQTGLHRLRPLCSGSLCRLLSIASALSAPASTPSGLLCPAWSPSGPPLASYDFAATLVLILLLNKVHSSPH